MTANSTERTTCLIRFHDGRIKANWGGRATSLALYDLLDGAPGRSVGTVINGAYIIRGFEGMVAPDDPVLDRHPRAAPPSPRAGGLKHAFRISPAKRAKQLLRNRRRLPAFGWIVEQFEACDAVVMNGEGDFIVTERPTLWRSLVLMAVALELGKEVHLVNSMFSGDGEGSVDEHVVGHVESVLERCATVSFRDPLSLELAQGAMAGVDARHDPDALFSWVDSVERLGPLLDEPIIDEVVPPDARRILRSSSPYVAVSGSSVPFGESGPPGDGLCDHLLALRSLGLPVLVVATCDRDVWMLHAARSVGVPSIPPRVSLITAVRILSGAAVLVSGRFHPSVLASLCGTPSVFLASNSHKSSSLPAMLRLPQAEAFPFFGDGDDLDAVVGTARSLVEEGGRRRAAVLARARELGAASAGMVRAVAVEA